MIIVEKAFYDKNNCHRRLFIMVKYNMADNDEKNRETYYE